MAAKKSFKPQNLRSLLGFLLVVIIVGSGALFYFSLEQVRQYAISVNHRIQDADASAGQIQQLQLLKSKLASSNDLVTKANQLFSTPDAYQTQALTDIRNYASATGLSVASTSFGDPTTNGGVYSITITLSKPVSYSKLLAFLNDVEGNIPKMQVSSLDLSYVESGNADSVNVGDTTIKISVH
ncbi:MAG TPA: GspMb/PilO family protein [Dongiaceae bacterium]|nr:GspMb/PilO family protein [Dongiaceae bacterium]